VLDEGNALDLFNEMVAATNPRAINNDYLYDDGSYARGGRLADEGNRPVLEVYRPFHEETVLPETYNRSSGGDYAYQLTPRQARALVVLHELRHITGTLDGTHNGNPVGENEDLVTRCILAAQRVGGPIQVTAPPDSPAGQQRPDHPAHHPPDPRRGAPARVRRAATARPRPGHPGRGRQRARGRRGLRPQPRP
jgi:hypothetical protein